MGNIKTVKIKMTTCHKKFHTYKLKTFHLMKKDPYVQKILEYFSFINFDCSFKIIQADNAHIAKLGS